MNTVRTVQELHDALAAAHRDGRSIGFVPTMGAFHAGHLALIARARTTCDVVVASVFVNPAQFDDQGDLAAYPRDEARDARLAAEAGVDVLFSPSADEVYPAGFATTVRVAGVAEPLEGVARGAGHFAGVATVVTKLLNMVGPDVVFFGQKDAQQVLVVRRLVRDLDLPVRIEVVPIVRDADGLALSSRNPLLSADERRRALALSQALGAGRRAVETGERDPAAVLGAADAVLRGAGVEPEYLALVDPETLEPLVELREPALLAVSARVGATRLIDNALIVPAERGTPHPSPDHDIPAATLSRGRQPA